jgi:two-component system, NtrC family, nitrogen regulation sensor histidine kinase NtrY
MGFDRRSTGGGYALPAVGLVLVAGLLGSLMRVPGFYANKLLLLGIAALMVWLLWSRTRRSNLLIARFVAALDHGDLTQAFRSGNRGAGFDQLGNAFDRALRRLREERQASVADSHFSSALVDEAPTPLLAVDDAGAVHLTNKAARRLFREGDGRPVGHFDRYGIEFATLLGSGEPGQRRVCRIGWNGLSQRAVVAVALVDRQGRPWRIVSVQIIQGELDAAELATQTDLVRVLTHEIMNSLTPVTSLAASAARLLAMPEGDEHAIADARLAVDALARRASGIAHFVDSYRAFSEAPSITRSRFAGRPWIEELLHAFRATPQSRNVALALMVAHEGLTIDGDANLLGQVVLNLLKNAGQAVGGGDAPQIEVHLGENDAGRIELRVSDNGPGVAPGLEEEIFLPFFTTKSDGTGVGLSFARQIVLLHSGAIGVVPSHLGGAAIQIII